MTEKERLQEIIGGQDKIIIKIMNDVRIPTYIRDVYAKEYNKLQINVVDLDLCGDDDNI